MPTRCCPLPYDSWDDCQLLGVFLVDNGREMLFWHASFGDAHNDDDETNTTCNELASIGWKNQNGYSTSIAMWRDTMESAKEVI